MKLFDQNNCMNVNLKQKQEISYFLETDKIKLTPSPFCSGFPTLPYKTLAVLPYLISRL